MNLNGKSNYIFSFYFILNFDYIFFILIIINKKMIYFNNKRTKYHTKGGLTIRQSFSINGKIF